MLKDSCITEIRIKVGGLTFQAKVIHLRDTSKDKGPSLKTLTPN